MDSNEDSKTVDMTEVKINNQIQIDITDEDNRTDITAIDNNENTNESISPKISIEYKTGVEEKKSMNNANEVAVTLTRTRFILVIISLVIALTMASLDISIVATALPVISTQFHSHDNYTWVITAYLLASTSTQPTCGKLADIFGRRPVVLTLLIVFILSSATCGASQSIGMLIASRAVQGIGGGGIISMVNIITSDIVPLRDRGTYMGIINTVFSFSSVVGPLIGGFLTDKISWRWAFYINVPLCVIAVIFISLFVNIPIPKGTFMEKFKRIDFLGTFLLVASIISLLLALNWGGTQYAWSSSTIIVLLVVFAIALCAYIFVEFKVAKEPITPPRLFKIRNVTIGALGNFLIGIIFLTLNNTISLLYQDGRGLSATISGLRITPSSITNAIAGIGSGILIGKYGHIDRYIQFGSLTLILGSVLISMIGISTEYYKELLIYLLLGASIGFSMQNLLVMAQSSGPMSSMAIITSTILFSRIIGGVVGVAIFGTFLKNKFVNSYTDKYPDAGNVSVNDIGILPEGKEIYVKAINFSYRMTFVPTSIILFILTLFLKKVVFHKKVEKKIENEKEN